MSNLSDIRQKKIPITLGEKTYHLHYDLNAFAELEEIYGSVEAAMNALCEGSVKAIINVLRAGLLHENEALTQKDIGKMFDLSNIKAVGELINQAITEAMPKSE
ncbi:MAG: hypothetical protein A2Y25_12030 [Candidatus Melainabacteria bacterium GWF2_37_15]|nr:MAG: hypothetical protein A2Y25_12030 [Candidatus Melainabacteria bacterium GWF2_37_15]